MIHCTPSAANFRLLSVKAIFAVVSGVLLMQTKIFMTVVYYPDRIIPMAGSIGKIRIKKMKKLRGNGENRKA